MPEAASTEFWRDLVPITKVFQPDAKPEVYLANAPTDDERYYVPITDTVSSRPLLISPTENRWCDILMAKSAGLVNRHYHPHQVFAFTLSGKWGYLEHDWTATAGDFVYETPGEGHTLVAYESRADARLLQRRRGRSSGWTSRARRTATSTSTTTSRCARSTTRRSGSAPTTWSRCSADHAGTSMRTFPTAPRLDGVVGVGDALEREAVQRQGGQRAGAQRRAHVRARRRASAVRGHRVDEHEAQVEVGEHQRPRGDRRVRRPRWRSSTIDGVRARTPRGRARGCAPGPTRRCGRTPSGAASRTRSAASAAR